MKNAYTIPWYPVLAALFAGLLLAGGGCAMFRHDAPQDYEDDSGENIDFSTILGGGFLLPPPVQNPVPDTPPAADPEEAGEQAETTEQPAAGDVAEAASIGEVPAAEADTAPLPADDILPEGVIPILGEDGEPVLREGLVLGISVLVNDKVEVPGQNYLISLENSVTLPFVGAVSCEGLTIRQFRKRLTELYADFFHDPTVRAEFVTSDGGESPWGKVRVMGHVGREGWINIPATRDLSLLRALQLAGGVSRGAKRTDVRITRNTPDGGKKTFHANLDKLGKEGDVGQDIPLEPGDTVWVDERVW